MEVCKRGHLMKKTRKVLNTKKGPHKFCNECRKMRLAYSEAKKVGYKEPLESFAKEYFS